ncbi:MAG: class I SAM-dependent RNA methyltransferase, partial [Pseudomonadota bacterium]
MTNATIERLGHLGDGIAAGPLYVPRALPGEVVTGEVEGDRLRDMRVVTPSPDRVRAPCRHYKGCGGCALQHASDALVSNWKTDIVTRAMEAQGLSAPIRAIHTSRPESRRRATFTARRTKKGSLVGFHAPASDVVVEVPDCRLVTPNLRAALPAVGALCEQGAARRGSLAVTVTETETGLDI